MRLFIIHILENMQDREILQEAKKFLSVKIYILASILFFNIN